MYAYTELINKFNRSTNPNKRKYKLENNTYVYFDSTDNFIIELHTSDIARITQDKIVLDSCGWKTPTTKDRLNKILDDNETGYGIFQKNRVWYVWDSLTGNITPFCDGINFKYNQLEDLSSGWDIE